MKNYFNELNNIDVSEKIEKKNGLSYLSWAWAWGELKKKYPMSYYTVYENEHGWNYFTDGKTGWVKTGVTVILEDSKQEKIDENNYKIRLESGMEHIEYLPIMDFRNKSIPLENITSFDVNKAIQRSLTKAVARHGLGLYIYAGEDLPEEAAKEKSKIDKLKDEIKTKYKDKAQDKLKEIGKKLSELTEEELIKMLEELKNA